MTIAEEVAKYIETYCTSQSMPYSVYLNWVDESKPSIGVVQSEMPVVAKEYINGSRLCSAKLSVYMQDKHTKRNNTISRLGEVTELFNRKNWKMSPSSDRCIMNGEITAPSLRNLTENGMSCFGTTIVILYKE